MSTSGSVSLVYLDTSVVLAHLLAEDRRPPVELWAEALVSSRLLQYEVWTRIHGRGLSVSHRAAVEDVLGRVALLELAPPILSRALAPFPLPVRTLDALHLSSALFLQQQSQTVALASYDSRQLEVAGELRLPLYAPAGTPLG